MYAKINQMNDSRQTTVTQYRVTLDTHITDTQITRNTHAKKHTSGTSYSTRH